jgi:glycolate oxidase subunit GlcD
MVPHATSTSGYFGTMMQTLPKSLLRGLRELVGPANVITDPDRLVVYESDGLTAYRRSPRAVVLPATTEEVAGAVRLLHAEGVAVVPRGAGTGLSGGALPTPGGVVLGTARMNRILALDPDNRRAVSQPGVLNSRLTEAARPFGLYYAPDPSSQSTCTLGGNVAENSGGPHCLKYGVTSRYITGLTVVMAGGRVARLGGAGRSVDGGLDLVGLFVGSEGCFGIATEIEVRLLPVAEGVRTLLGIFDTMEAAGHAVTAILSAGLTPAALEIVDAATIRAVEASIFAAGYPADAGAALVVEFDGSEAGLDVDAERAEAHCRAAGARDVRRATDDAHRAALWKGRKKAFGAMGRIAPDLLVQDATVPRTRLPAVLARIAEIGERYRLEIANVFHAGDGNLHPNILFDRNDADELARVERASKEIRSLCVEAGGTITGEHGVGVDKRAYMPLVHGPEELATMAAVKRAWDPDLLFNPGKVVPELGGAAEPAQARVRS